MNEAVVTASYSRHHSFYRSGVVEPDKYQVEPPPVRCCPCGVKLAQLNPGELCFRHQEIERRLRVRALSARPSHGYNENVPKGHGRMR